MLMVSVFYGANFLYGRGKAYLLVAKGAYREFFALLEDICAGWMGEATLQARGAGAVTMQVLPLSESANLYAWANPDEPVDRIRDADRAMLMLRQGLGPLPAQT